MINGLPYYHFHLRRQAIGPQDRFGLGSFLAFFSTRVLRSGPRGLIQVTTGFVLLVLALKILSHRTPYSAWSWQKPMLNNDSGDLVEEGDGSIAGGLRIVVFGDKDVATPGPLENGSTEDAQARSWTERLCDELDCSSYLSLVPTSDDPSRVMTSTKLYATSVEQALNLTTVETYGPGLDYNFMLDQFPIEWKVNDLSKQVDEFLSKKKPKNSPAQTLWVFSFGAWDIWSLATEPLTISKDIVDSMVEQVFLQVERLYESAMDETSIAWSEPEVVPSTSTTTSDGLPTPTPDPNTSEPWIKQRDINEGEGDHPSIEALNGTEDAMPDTTKHFRILIPKLFDPSLTPGWHDSRPLTPGVHSKAEQMRNAAALTEEWNSKMWSALAEWIRTEERRQHGDSAHQPQPQSTVPPPIGGKRPIEIINDKIVAELSKDARRQRAKAKAVALGGQNHVHPRSPPPPPPDANDEEVPPTPEQQEPGSSEENIDLGPPRPQRDGILYSMNTYLEEVIVQRQLHNSGLRDARKGGKLTEEGFIEVWTPCVGVTPEPRSTAIEGPSETAAAEEVESVAEVGPVAAYERKRSVGTDVQATTPAALPSNVSAPQAGAEGVRICDDPDEHLFYTGFTVSPRAVETIARQAADMVRKNETVRAGRRDMPKLKWVGG